MKQIIETKRLFLRELKLSDTEELSQILCDNNSMKYYPRPFTTTEVERWIKRSVDSYRKNNHGLWAVILKETGEFLGDCGITIQEIDGELLPELGYHIKKQYCNRGFASEAAKVCISYAFERLSLNTLYTYTDTQNIPSIKVAQKIGMKYIKGFKKQVMGKTVDEVLYAIDNELNNDKLFHK